MPETIIDAHASVATPGQLRVPLCVDLDGTLVKSDTLIDSLLLLLRSRPLKCLALPGKVLAGKAAFKAYVTANISLDVAHLPYNRKLLAYLHAEYASGREIYLATGADVRLAERVAEHLGIFAGVLGSDGAVNLTGSNKLDRLRASMAAEIFDYIGNALADVPLLSHAAQPMVANPSAALRRKMRSLGIHPAQEFEDRANPIFAMFKAIRVHQWAKNALICLPLLLSHRITVDGVQAVLLAFCCFSLAASSMYILNDLFDMESDRTHPQKQLRPFASGDLSAPLGFAVAAIFLGLALAGARFLPAAFVGWLLLYLATTIAYTTYLKRIALVDVFVLSGLYTLRLLAGSAATGTPISHWLAGFSVFLFLSLAIVKRFAELQNLRTSGAQPQNGRGYMLADIEQLRSFGTSSASAAVVIFAIYISGQDVQALYRNPSRLWLVVPLMILWLYRVWLLASRGDLDEDPVIFAMTDRMSLVLGAAVAVIVLLAI
jgi:4-hydroxybenzoate polyprenyltransferase/phosphoserine phosphatase